MKYHKYILLFIAVGVASGFYLYNKPVESTLKKKSELTIQAGEFLREFQQNETAANDKYLDKIVSVNGTVGAINEEDGLKNLTLYGESEMFGVVCKFEKHAVLPKGLKTGDQLRVKGVCTGMLMDVVMIRCVIENEDDHNYGI